MHGIASIPVGLPENSLRVRNVGYRLAVFGEDHPLGGEASQEGLEQFGLRVETGKLATADRAFCKDPASVLAWNRSTPTDGARGQLNRTAWRPPKEAAPLIESPDLVSCQVQEEFSIRGPADATRMG